jgi:hypothetical protein
VIGAGAEAFLSSLRVSMAAAWTSTPAGASATVFEHRVSGRRAVAIVDRFEPVKIQIDKRRAGAARFDVGDRPFELALKAAVIQKFGERIDIDLGFEIDDSRTIVRAAPQTDQLRLRAAWPASATALSPALALQ